jgi:alpha-mannosidase
MSHCAPEPPVYTVHLVSNAHLDPVWLWEWEEGVAAALSTFRTAADLCEEFPGFVFNHNEAVLYQWVEQYEPALFTRIQKLVRLKKWHIMGGWYLQPDCNMPSGESLVRQILLGRQYFQTKFKTAPTTTINVDSFGHTRGLVQILAKSGYDSYLFCRPGQTDCPLAQNEFIWEGYDGSRVLARRATEGYLSALGKAREKVEQCLREHPDRKPRLLLWGVGNHGGGPSRQDLRALADLKRSVPDRDIRHSTPENYFAELIKQPAVLPVHRGDLNPSMVGCYTSQVRIKQKHRLLENELFAVEKMAAAAWCQGLLAYPQAELREALRDLAFCQFHDILPGSSIQPVEEMALRTMDHGLEILSRAKARAFFALSQGQPAARENQIPILVYNPHPFPIKTTIECEFQLADQNWTDTYTKPTVYQGERPLPTQTEKELSNLALDWRKRVVFAAELAPAQMNRFDCRLETLPTKPVSGLQPSNRLLRFVTDEIEVIVNTQTGLLDRYRVHGVDCLAPNACCPLVMADNADPWGMRVNNFRKPAGKFTLLSPKESACFSGVPGPLPSVRVIEDGPVRVVIEAVMGYNDSRLCLHYQLPRQGTEMEVTVRVLWNEKDRMLKLSLPTPDQDADYWGQVAYGKASLPQNGNEAVAQKWVAVVSKTRALTVINDGTYGSDFSAGELRLSLLRSPGYSVHPILERPLLPADRYLPRIDQGERLFRFWINAGEAASLLAGVDREALVHNEKPMALSFFPSGTKKSRGRPFITLSDDVVQLTALKKAETGNGLIIRLFEPTGTPRSTTVAFPGMKLQKKVILKGFEIRTYHVDIKKRAWTETDLMEKRLNQRI